MSSLKPLDMLLIVPMFETKEKPGFVLNFSNRTLSEFFKLQLGINIDAPKYAVEGDSKLKRLRYFLKTEDDATVARTLHALGEYRKALGPASVFLTQVSDGPEKLKVREPGRLLLKSVAAVTEDVVRQNGMAVGVNGRDVAIARISGVDGRRLPARSGCSELSLGDVLPLRDASDSSDGRYVGKSRRTRS